MTLPVPFNGNWKWWFAAAWVASVGLGLGWGPVAAQTAAGLMTKEELKPLIGNPDVVILDVRIGKDWTASEFKIKGAEQANPKAFNDWKDRYSKEQTLVLYCA
jgi:hypothetical protein